MRPFCCTQLTSSHCIVILDTVIEVVISDWGDPDGAAWRECTHQRLIIVVCIPAVLVVTVDVMLVGVLIDTLLTAVSEMEYVLSSSTGVVELFVMV